MSDPYAETDIWPVPARHGSLTASEPENAPTPTRAPDRAREGLVEQLRLHQFDLSEARKGNPACICGDGLTVSVHGVDRAMAHHQVEVLLPLVEAHTAAQVEAAVTATRAERDEARSAMTLLDRMLGEARRDRDDVMLKAIAAESDRDALPEKIARVEADLRWAKADLNALHRVLNRVEALAERLHERGYELTPPDRGILPVEDGVRGGAFIELARQIRAALSDPTTTDQPEPEAWIDRHGDVWREGDDGLMHSFETAPFSREHVEKKWGPLRPTTTFHQTGGES